MDDMLEQSGLPLPYVEVEKSGDIPVAWVDLDGVLANTRQRWHLIEDYMLVNGTKRGFDWVEYARACVSDTPVTAMINTVKALRRAGVYIVICTSRPEGAREETEMWLTRWDVPVDEVLMSEDNEAAHNQAEWKDKTLDAWLRSHNVGGFYIAIAYEDNWEIATVYRKKWHIPVVVIDIGHGTLGDPPDKPKDDA